MFFTTLGRIGLALITHVHSHGQSLAAHSSNDLDSRYCRSICVTQATDGPKGEQGYICLEEEGRSGNDNTSKCLLSVQSFPCIVF